MVNKVILEAWEQMKAAITPDGYVCPRTGGIIRRSPRMVTYITIIGRDGSIHHSDNQACHAGLMLQHPRLSLTLPKPRYVVSRIQFEAGPRLDDSCIDAFLRWLTVKSPYSGVFVTKGGKSNREHGFLATRTDVPSNLLAGALIASRALTEHNGSIARLWYEMQKRGINPNIAFCLAHEISCPDGRYVIDKPMNWHSAISGGSINKNFIINFKQSKMVYRNSFYKDSLTYKNVYDTWGITSYDDRLTQIKKKCLELSLQKSGSKNVNPFTKNAVEREGSDLHLFMDLYCPAVIEYFGEDNV